MKLKHRNIIHRHARLRSGAGGHKDKRKEYPDMEDVRMSLKDFREEHGITCGTDLQDALKEWREDETVPALCHNGCEVSHDAECEHGCPSILKALSV